MTRPPIPKHAGEVSAQWMQQALTAGGASDLPPVKEIVLEEIGAGVGFMGAILRCHLSYDEPKARDAADLARPAAEQNPAAPETVIVKLPSPHAKNRRLSKHLGLHKGEYNFYRLVASQAPVRSPALLYGDFEASTDRFVLLLEDLGSMETGSLFGGASAEQTRRAIRAIAKLHGTFWNKTDQPPLTGYHDSFAPNHRKLVQLVYVANLAPAFKGFGSFFSDDMRRLAKTYGSRIADHIRLVAAGPKTLSHGDFRLDNIFFAADAGDDIAVIDWQVSGLRSPLYDVAYFMGGSVTTEVRRQIEREVLEEYTGIIGDMGVEGFTFEECWRLYREHSLANLLVMVFACGGLDLSDERGRQVVEVGLQRILAMIEDLDAGACLPAPAPFFSRAGAFSAFSRGAYGVVKALRR